MHSVSWAEWIIARCTDRSRAASIFGDLLEESARTGPFRFWLSVTGIVISFTWRRPVAFVIALYLGLYAFGALQVPIFGRDVLHRPHGNWAHFLTVVAGFGMVLWIAAPYTAIRYGLRDKFAQLALALCALITAFTFYWWLPVVGVGSVLLGSLILALSFVTVQRRRALFALAASLAFGFGSFLLVLFLFSLMPDEQKSSLIATSAALLAVWILTATCSRVHDLFLCRD